MDHELKIYPKYFDAILSGEKTFEIRRNDRGFCYLPKKYYFLLKRKDSHSCADSVLFRLSHVRKLEKIN